MSTKICAFHEDVFYKYFLPYRHPKANHDIWGGHGLETFGDDLQIVRGLDEQYLWTVMDGSTGSDVWITPGYRWANRICYLVTQRAHKLIPVEFRVPRPLTSLTPIGLSRQVKKIELLLSSRQTM